MIALCVAMFLNPCPVVETRPLLALTYGGEVYIDSAFSARLSEAERAFVTAHEFGHILARHNKHDGKTAAQKEFEADELATLGIVKIGLPCRTGAVLLRRLHVEYRHPSFIDRARRVEALC